MTSRLEPDELETLTSGSAVEGWRNTLAGRLEGAPCPYHNKTPTAIGVLELIDEWPALVMCPGHMVGKWQRSLEQASDPQDPITARVITRPALGKPPRWIKSIKPAIQAAGGVVERVEREQVAPIAPSDLGYRRRLYITPKTCRHTKDILSALNRRCTFRDPETGTKQPPKVIQHDIHGLVVEYVDRDAYTLFDFVDDYRAGRLGQKAATVVSFEPAKYGAGDNKAQPGYWLHRKVQWSERLGIYQAEPQPTCPTCGEVVTKGERFCGNTIPRFVVEKEGETSTQERVCRTPLFNFNRWRRVGLAELVNRKFKGFFKVYLADEVHKAKSGRTDIGTADQRFLSSIRYSLALTGTLFGGTAGSLFYLLYRRSREVRQRYGYQDINRWVDHYGVWERTWDQDKPYVTEHGASTGIARWNYRQRELPGVGPGVIRYLLPLTLFGNIEDLEYRLPALHEEVIELDMSPELAEQYHEVHETLLKQALDNIREYGDVGSLSVWFNTVRFRPCSAFRDELVNYVGKKGGKLFMSLPAVVIERDFLPKEQELSRIVRANLAKKRRTLCFVEQTGTRDIRDRLQYTLEKLVPGGEMTLVEVPRLTDPTVVSLSAGDMPPARREAWIKLHAPRMDAMLVNPKLVETGLDLVMFSDLVFYETTTSLYTMWQAMRRVWRLGQSKDVRVRFLAYAGTMEAEILRRMGQKMKYAQLLYGKSAAGVLVESDQDDVQREIINAALEGKAFESAGEAIRSLGFSTSNGLAPIDEATEETPEENIMVPEPLIVTHLPTGEAVQLTLFGEVVPVEQIPRRRKVRKSMGKKRQLKLW